MMKIKNPQIKDHSVNELKQAYKCGLVAGVVMVAASAALAALGTAVGL